MYKLFVIICGGGIFLLFSLSHIQAEEIKSRYATISFQNPALLREFNNNFEIGNRLYRNISKRKNFTVADEVKNKVDVVVEKVEIVLDMFPEKVFFNIVLIADDDGIKKIHQNVYHRGADYIAFFSPKKNTVYLSVDDISLRVLAHEIGHVIVENYFKISPPPKMHELLAQFAAAHISD